MPEPRDNELSGAIPDQAKPELMVDVQSLYRRRRRRLWWQTIWLTAMGASLVTLLLYIFAAIRELEDVRGDVSSAAAEIARMLAEQAPPPDAGGGSAPIGTILAYGGAIDKLPSNWLFCDGASKSKIDYPELFNVIGTGMGGDGNPFFNIPDLRGVFLRGAYEKGHSGKRQDPDGVRRIGSYQKDATRMPNRPFVTSLDGKHSHTLKQERAHGRDPGNVSGWAGTNVSSPGLHEPRTSEYEGHTHSLSGGDPETRPVNVAVYWIIRAK